jgi:hypothetical protein
MNTSKLKSFAPEVRRQLMEAVERKLDYVLTADTADLRAMGTQVSSLRRQAEKERDALVERVAYTWFNRLAALRFLDARGWHPFKARVLTPATPDETQPEVLKLLRTGSLPEELRPHTDLARLNDLLDGRLPTAIAGADPQGEVYRHLILAACRLYHATMPFLFEELDDETELLLPDDLLTATSVAEGFRTEISDDDCSEVEILGWLYQFYISEKKDAVMARKKAVPSEDIPAVTQLFTPHWIVRYLVENSLGRLWLRSRPNSRLKDHMPYYVEDPEGQTPADSLTVATAEEIKLLDPASGSGHMLTYAFDLLVKIYEEEGHAPSEIPEKILTHNLFGLEICPRAAQLAQFALVCKAREQSRTAFRRPVQPQILCLRDVGLTPDEVKGFADATGSKFSQDELAQIHQFRENTETFGSLIQPVLDEEKLAALKAKIGEQATAGDLLVQNTHRKLRLVLDQAEMLSKRYQIFVANPPYMGAKQMDEPLLSFCEDNYKLGAADLFSCFIEKSMSITVNGGLSGLITMQGWLFQPSFIHLRRFVFSEQLMCECLHLGAAAFDSIGGEVVKTTAFVINTSRTSNACQFVDLTLPRGEARKERAFLDSLTNSATDPNRVLLDTRVLLEIPGSPAFYKNSEAMVQIFKSAPPLGTLAALKAGLTTGDNIAFQRLWHEVCLGNVMFDCSSVDESERHPHRWYPCSSGGEFRKWYRKSPEVVDWERNGIRIRNFTNASGKLKSRPQNTQYYFRRGFTWNKLSTSNFAVRLQESGWIYDDTSRCGFANDEAAFEQYFAFLCSRVSPFFLGLLNPSMSFTSGDLGRLPIIGSHVDNFVTPDAICLARADWDNFETSWDFRDLPLLRSGDWEVESGQPGGAWKGRTLAESWANYAAYCAAAIRRMQELETENNRLWIDAYGLQDELTPEVPEDEITLARADKAKDVAAFLSYAVGCMMGRYSPDQPGLILADAGDTVENYLAKVGKPLDQLQFPPDEDAIIPVLEGEWFEDDIVARTREFLRVSFGEATLKENLRFIEESLGKSLEKYFLTDFYKDHLQTYKKRPIYWLFQSPKKGFSALVYLHRYTKDTVNTLLNDYLRDFLKKLESRIEHLAHVQDTASSAREKSAAAKEEAKLKKTLKECREWERDVLLPLAQQRLEIDLDDGVKANYPKFGEALAPIPGLAKKEN